MKRRSSAETGSASGGGVRLGALGRLTYGWTLSQLLRRGGQSRVGATQKGWQGKIALRQIVAGLLLSGQFLGRGGASNCRNVVRICRSVTVSGCAGVREGYR